MVSGNAAIGALPGATPGLLINQSTDRAALEAALAAGNVLVTTGTTGNQDGDITVAESFAWDSDSTLTLSAFRHIWVNDGVTIANTGAGHLNLRADETGTGHGGVEFLGSAMVDFSQSTGTVSIFYNPPSGYAFPLVYDPFVITNPAVADQLTAFMLVNDVFDLQDIQQNLSGSYALGTNIDASSTFTISTPETLVGTFVPIGTDSTPFSGLFDGRGHVIDQLATAQRDDIGLFGYIGSTGIVRNLNLHGAFMTIPVAPRQELDGEGRIVFATAEGRDARLPIMFRGFASAYEALMTRFATD